MLQFHLDCCKCSVLYFHSLKRDMIPTYIIESPMDTTLVDLFTVSTFRYKQTEKLLVIEMKIYCTKIIISYEFVQQKYVLCQSIIIHTSIILVIICTIFTICLFFEKLSKLHFITDNKQLSILNC